MLRRLGELSKILTDAGFIFISSLSDLDDYDLEKLKILNAPNEILVINIGKSNFERYTVDMSFDLSCPPEKIIDGILDLLTKKDIVTEYQI